MISPIMRWLNIAPCADRAGGIAKSAQWGHTHWKAVCMTSLCWLCYPIGIYGRRDINLSQGEDNEILCQYNMVWIKQIRRDFYIPTSRRRVNVLEKGISVINFFFTKFAIFIEQVVFHVCTYPTHFPCNS